MAATQAEKQQNDVNSEKVQPDQHLNLRNTLLQNGTEKSGVRGGSGGNVVVTKTKASSTSAKNQNLGNIEMSQYRQDGVPGSCPAPQSINEQSINSGSGLDSDLNQNTDVNTYPPVSESAIGGDAPSAMHSYGFPFGGGGGRPGGGSFPQHANSSVESQQHNPGQHQQQNNADGSILQGFGQFGSQAIRHGFPGSKQPMIGPRPTSAPVSGQVPFHQQQRFISGQTISQPTGPTPTLNQLLQSSNPMHRYQNSYGHGEQGPYSQSWQSQKSIPSYNPQGLVSSSPSPLPAYRNQPVLSSTYSGPSPSSPGSYDQQQPSSQSQQHPSPRQCWNNQPPSQNQHHPPSPGGAAGNRQSPQPGSHSPGPGMPASPQQQNTPQQQQQQPPPSSVPGAQSSTQSQPFPSRPAQPTTPSAHAPDTGDLTGQNSNDSSNGPAPGTPNSQGMRPTPSPTGSTGSRSMSPAVGQQNIPMPPRPSSSQSDGSGPTRMSHSPMATPSGYQQHLGPPPHLGHSAYKMGNHPGISASGQQMGLYNTSGQQQYQLASSGGYAGARPQGNMQYSGPNQSYAGTPPVSSTQQGPTTNNMSMGAAGSGGQYPNRPLLNHVPHGQYPAYQQSWSSTGPTACSPAGTKGTGPGGALPSIVQSPGNMGPQPTNSVGAGARPPHYLKQHLQHKIGFGSSGSGTNTGPGPGGSGPNPGALQGYNASGGGAPGMGPPMHQHSGLSMGPPVGTTGGHHHQGMGPPASMGPPANMAPPSSTGMPVSTSAPPLMQQQMSNNHEGPPIMPPPSSTPNSHSMHSLSMTHSSCDAGSDILDNGITTTATGNMITHVTSAAGGSVTSVVTTGPDGTTLDEGSQQSTLSNTSAASGEDHQCATPKSRKNEIASGGHYSHPATPQSTVPSPGAASMNSMHEEYDMSSPSWPRTPASPKTDSLGKLYEMDDSPDRRAWLDKLLAFMEERRTPITTCPTISKNPLDLFRLYMYVKERGGFMEVTKNKTWKDIAGMLGIGASSSAAYTLRKHYTKNLLAYECQFDRGGIDPQPIINQVEASSKKKSAKAASVPSPGSSNSQDSFPPPGSSGTSMDGYGGYGYPPGSTPDYNNSPMQRPSSQTNAPSPHAGMQQGGYPGQSGYNQYPGPGPGTSPEQYQNYPSNSGYPPANRAVYPQYGGAEGDRNYTQSSSNNTGSVTGPPNSQSNNQGNNQDHYGRYNMSSNNYASPRTGYCTPPTVPPTGSTSTQSPASPYPSQQDYYRPDQQGPPPPVSGPSGQLYPNGPPSKTMPPPAPQPRRHPDFAKDQQAYPPYAQQRPQIYGWPNSNQYRGQYQAPNIGPSSPQQWNQVGNRPGVPHNNQNVNSQWEQRYPASGQPGFQGSMVQQGGQQWSPIPTPGIGQSSPLRPPLGPRSSFRPDGKPLSMLPPQGMKNNQAAGIASSTYPQQPLPKREISFPPDSVEATIPVLYRRKRICRLDMGNVDAWKIMMSLRSGLLTETTYALDALNILLFDDSTVPYFGLNQWPGMLDLLLEHFRKSLNDMFDSPILCEPDSDWYKTEKSDVSYLDLGAPKEVSADDHQVILNKTPNYTQVSRKNEPVKLLEKNDDIFIEDSHKEWDVDGDAAGTNVARMHIDDSWQLGNTNPTTTKYILPCFQAEFNNTQFFQHLDNEEAAENKLVHIKEEVEDEIVDKNENEENDDNSTDKKENIKPLDKKKRTKTLSDVISRIKKDNSDENEILAQELKEKVKTEPEAGEDIKVKTEDEESTAICDGAEESRSSEDQSKLLIKDTAGTLKRRRMSDYEDECYTRDEASLCLITDSQDAIAKRCVCISNILRNLTFIPGNENEFAKSTTFLSLLGKLLLLHHEHPIRTQKTRNYDREEDADFADSCSSLYGESEWWWDFLVQIRENVLVSCANISGHMDLSQYDEVIARPVLDGLLHWAVCPSAHGQDPFANIGQTSLLSPQRLALESLCKLCVTDSNVDLVIATPPFSRLERLCAVLTKHLCRSEDQVLREFSVNLLHYLAAANTAMARVVAMQSPCVSLLVAFIEQAEQSALGVANQHGIGALRENPDSMGTSLDMLRRAAGTLLHLAKHPDNRPLFLQQEQRLLHLVMSQILDQQVAFVIARVLFHISRTNEISPKVENS